MLVERPPTALPDELLRALQRRPGHPLPLVPAADGRGVRAAGRSRFAVRPRRVDLGVRRAARKGAKNMADEKKTALKAADKEAKAKDAALQAAVTQIEREFGQGSLMRLGDESAIQVEAIPTGALSLDLALGRRRGAARADRRDLRPGVLGQDDARLPHHRRGPGARRDLRLRRHRARDRPDLREADRGRRRRAARLPARLRRAGARDRRRPGPLRRGRPGRDRLGGGADAAGRARGPDGGDPGRPPGTADVAGASQAGRQPQPRQHRLRVHEPDPGEDRRHASDRRRPSPAGGR